MEKVVSGVQCLISPKRANIRRRRTVRKPHGRFRLVPKSTTLDDLEGSLCSVFQKKTCATVLFHIFSFTFSLLLCSEWLHWMRNLNRSQGQR